MITLRSSLTRLASPLFWVGLLVSSLIFPRVFAQPATNSLTYAEGGISTEDPDSQGAAKYYIDSQNGNDSNTGSISSPWKSVSKVNTHAGTAAPGTHYLFKRGLVYANVQTDLYNINGADGQRIVFGAYGSLTANKPRLDNIQFYGGTYLMIRDLHCKQIVIRSGTSHTIIYNNEVSGQGKQGIVGFKRVNHIAIVSNYLHDVAYSQEDVIVLHSESWNAATYEYDIGSNHWIIDNTVMMSGGNEDGIDIDSEHVSSDGRAIDFKVIGNRIMAQPNSGETKNAIQIGHWSEKVWVVGNTTGGYTTEDSLRLGPWQDAWKGVTEIAREYQVSGNASFFNGIYGANIRINFDDGKIFHNTLLSPTGNGFKWITSTGVTTADNVTTSSNVPGVSYPNLSVSFNKDPRNWNDTAFLQHFIPDASWSGNNGDATIGAFDSNGKRLGMEINSFTGFGKGWEGPPLCQQKLIELGVSWSGVPVIDTLAPTVPTNVVASIIASTTATISWTASTDNVGVAGYDVFQNGTLKTSVTSTSAAITGLTASTTYSFTVKAKDAAGNVSGASAPLSVTTYYPGAVVANAGGGFVNTSMSAQTGTFTATFNATPSASPNNGVVGLSNGSQTAYTGLATAVRFNTTGKIDARNGGAYAAANVISFSANTTYAFRLVVNVPARTYSIYVTPSGGSELTVGTNYAFRTEQNTVSTLNNWAAVVDTTANGGAGTLTVWSFSLGATPPSTPTFTPAAGSYNAAQSVTIASTGSTSIRYTLDGSTPTTSSTLYSGVISIGATTTLKAIGVNSAGSSSVTTGVYTITIPSSANLSPVADTYAFGGATSTNYGTALILGAKDDGTTATSFDRVVFIKFNLTGLGFTPTTATLMLTTDATTQAGTLTVNQCTTDSWTETGLTWANKPATGAVIGTATVTAGVVADKLINVGSYVNSQYTGDATKIVTFALTGSNAQLYLKSRETGAADSPTLIVGN